MEISVTDMNTFIAFWACFTRMLALVFQIPLFDNMNVPHLVKILAILVLSYAIFPGVSPAIINDIAVSKVESLFIITGFNIVVGLVIGIFVKAIMNICLGAAALITQNIGIGAIRYYDPTAGQELGPIEILVQWTLVVMIISTGALFPMLKGAYLSFFSISLSECAKLLESPILFLEMTKNIFISGLMLAAPLIFVNMLIMVVLGIVARVVPQLNIIMTSFVLHVGLGFLVFMATSEEFFNVAYSMYMNVLGEWFKFFT